MQTVVPQAVYEEDSTEGKKRLRVFEQLVTPTFPFYRKAPQVKSDSYAEDRQSDIPQIIAVSQDTNKGWTVRLMISTSSQIWLCFPVDEKNNFLLLY